MRNNGLEYLLYKINYLKSIEIMDISSIYNKSKYKIL